MALTWPHFSFENIFNFQIALKRTVYAIYQANGRQAVASQSKKSSVMPIRPLSPPIHPGIAGTGIAGTRFPALRNALYLALVPAAGFTIHFAIHIQGDLRQVHISAGEHVSGSSVTR